jgi:hypothetical protein
MKGFLIAALVGWTGAMIASDAGLAATGDASPKARNALAAAPSMRMSDQICGRPYTSVRQVFDDVAATRGIELLRNDDHYIAFHDDAAGVWWTFVKPKHPAGPAAVCRKLLEHGGQFYVHMEAMCHGPKRECDDLVDGFQKLLKTEK